MSRWAKALLAGGGTFVVATLALWLLLGVVVPIAGVLGAIVGVGLGLMTLPGAAQKLQPVAVEPTSTEGFLRASRESADDMGKQMARLTSRSLWSASGLDERIGEMLGTIRTLSAIPALQGRERSDGDVQTLFRIATDYLPTLVNLAIENDRMHASFRGAGSRDTVVDNVAALDEQSAILGEALEQIEADVAKGVSRDAAQHAAFLQSRFAAARTPAILDLSTAHATSHVDAAPRIVDVTRASAHPGQNGDAI